MTFYTNDEAMAFFDEIATAKGPSLGTNFTLSSPYAILAHYGELEWVCPPTLHLLCYLTERQTGSTIRR